MDGRIMLKHSHNKFIPVNRTHENKHQRVIGFQSPQRLETMTLSQYQSDLRRDNLSWSNDDHQEFENFSHKSFRDHLSFDNRFGHAMDKE